MRGRKDAAIDMRIAADQCIDRMTEEESLAGYLALVVRCPSQPYENQLLIWKQYPKASEVAGALRWKREGKAIREGEKPIWILLPYIRYLSGTGKPCRRDDGMILLDERRKVLFETEPEYESGFLPAAVFDVSQTQGRTAAERTDRNPEKIEDALRSLSITISEERTDALPSDLPDGYAADSTFHVARNLRDAGNRYYCVLLRLFANWVIGNMREPGSIEEAPEHGDIITVVCAYCIQRWYFGEGSEIRPALVAAKLKTLSHRERRDILRLISRYYYRILQYLTVPELGFTDTAVVNGLLDTGNVADLNTLFDRVQAEPELDEEIAYSISSLMDKLICAEKDFPAELYQKKLEDKVILSSPPVAIPTAYSTG